MLFSFWEALVDEGYIPALNCSYEPASVPGQAKSVSFTPTDQLQVNRAAIAAARANLGPQVVKQTYRDGTYTISLRDSS